MSETNAQRIHTLVQRTEVLREDIMSAATDMAGTEYESRLWSAWDQAQDVIEELKGTY